MSAPNQLVEFASPALVRALGWTLLHSLWQGAVLALGASLLLMLLHRHAAAVRYRVSAAALGLLLALAGGTFGYYYQAATAGPAAVERPTGAFDETTAAYDATATTTAASVAARGAETASRPEPAGAQPAAPAVRGLSAAAGGVGNWLAAGRAYFEQHLPLLVLAWLLGMLAMTLRFLGSLAYVQRLKSYRVAALPASWQARLDALAARAGLTRRVRLLASALVPGPLVVGWLRPVVLLPLSAATGLSNQELEAILAHELAHVRRHDYLLNLLQSVAEILFFYHPAVWFLSASLRTERENCCDDLATELCGDPVVLARALATLAALSLAPERTAPQLALAAAGPAGSLLGRVRRLVRPRAEVPTFLEGVGAACVVLAGSVVLGLGTVASLNASPVRLLGGPAANAAAASRPEVSQTEIEPDQTALPAADPETAADLSGQLPAEAAAYSPSAGDTVFVSAAENARLLRKAGRTRLTDIRGLTVVVQDEAGNVREVYADGQKVPAAALPAYRAALARQNSPVHRPVASTTPPAAPTDATGEARSLRMGEMALRIAQQALAGDTVSSVDAESLSSDALATAQTSLAAQAAAVAEADGRAQASAAAVADELDLLRIRLLREEAATRAQLKKLTDKNGTAAADQRRLLQRRLQELSVERQQIRRDLQQAQRDARRNLIKNEIGQELTDGLTARPAQNAGPGDLLVAEMRRDGLVSDPENFQFSLSKKEMTVNGRRQSAAVHDKYVRLYEAQSGRALTATSSYNIMRNGASNTSISNDSGSRTSRNRNLRDQVPPMPPMPPMPAMPPTPPMPATPPMPPMPPMPPAPARLNTDRIRAELRRDGVIEPDAQSFSLSWNAGVLIVNGRQQPPALAAKYRPLLGLSGRSGQNINIVVSDD
ncbi:M56 family metallopeptidase [uncultured Hymenobacter sp.]|uniref:M56 family metallopeptidase n=1 Tax=uncultured Hymenobacter sp. TaxID=170016 RepID=UPI0035CA9D3C